MRGAKQGTRTPESRESRASSRRGEVPRFGAARARVSLCLLGHRPRGPSGAVFATIKNRGAPH